MGFVENDDRVLLEKRVENGLSQQHSISHVLDRRLTRRRVIVKPNRVTNLTDNDTFIEMVQLMALTVTIVLLSDTALVVPWTRIPLPFPRQLFGRP